MLEGNGRPDRAGYTLVCLVDRGRTRPGPGPIEKSALPDKSSKTGATFAFRFIPERGFKRTSRHVRFVPENANHDFPRTPSGDARVCGEPDAASGLVANTVLYGFPKTNTFEVRQMIRSNSTKVRIFSRYFHNTRC